MGNPPTDDVTSKNDNNNHTAMDCEETAEKQALLAAVLETLANTTFCRFCSISTKCLQGAARAAGDKALALPLATSPPNF